jgi:protein gp37
MSDKTGIEWTDATWNPVTGCTKVSPGCDNCYAETLAERFRGTPGHYYEHGFDVQLRTDKLDQPLRWRRPRRVFVNSMSDLFHDDIPDDYIAQVFTVMAMADQHTFQVLTKRHGRMRSLLNGPLEGMVSQNLVAASDDDGVLSFDWPLPNVWLGVSAENQRWANTRINALVNTPAAVRFVSAEPLLGPIEYDEFPAVDWVIVGGESGRGARPMDADWARSLRDQCAEVGVAFHFKQAGAVLAREWGGTGKGGDPAHWPEPFPREFPDVS